MGTANEEIIPPPAVSGTQLIVSADDRVVWSDVRETDARTALTRGVKEYLETLKITWEGGRESRLLQVFDDWATPEVDGVLPSAIAYAPDVGTYEGDSFSTQTVAVKDADGGVITLRLLAELTQTITVEAWSTDPIERMALAAMLEDAFSPVDWMAGFRLRLPHYFGAFATFLPTNVSYSNDGDSSQKQLRRVIVNLEATIPVIRFQGVTPRLTATFKPTVTGPGS